MSWRDRLVSPSQAGGGSSNNGDRPTLEGVLDHYAVQYTHRYKQMVRCPLHEDNTPSMSVRLEDGVWKCHSCGAGGDAYTLIERMESITFDEARTLAASLNLPAGGVGGGGDGVPEGRYARHSRAPRQARPHARDGGYVPSWRRH